jgi:hypothetical protein
MKAQGYIDHTLAILDEFLDRNPETMVVEDKATPHAVIDSKKAKKSRSWIHIGWLPNSPDLKLIESIWRRIKQKSATARIHDLKI